MLEGLVNFFTSFIITSIGFYIIKQISTLNIKYINKKTLFLNIFYHISVSFATFFLFSPYTLTIALNKKNCINGALD